MSVSEEARYRANRQAEIDSAVVYRAMAASETSPQLTYQYGYPLAMVSGRGGSV